MTEVITGPIWAARNWSADEGEGSIHDDATAAKLGLVWWHRSWGYSYESIPPVLVKIFGNEWFERGNLSLNFKNATVDLEKVQVFVEQPASGAASTKVWMEREDGMLVATGTASLGEHVSTELRNKDYRPCDPSELRILHRLHAGLSLGEYDVHTAPTRQFERFDANLISDPLDWYRHESPWGEPVAAPATVLEFLWAYLAQGMRIYLGEMVGLFGAAEIAFHNGLPFMNRDYHLVSKVLCGSKSANRICLA